MNKPSKRKHKENLIGLSACGHCTNGGKNQFKWNSEDVGRLNQGERKCGLSSADHKDISEGLPSERNGFKGRAFPSPHIKAVSGLNSSKVVQRWHGASILHLGDVHLACVSQVFWQMLCSLCFFWL